MATNPVDPFGVDISSFVNGQPDLDPMFTPISGARVGLEAAARRLLTNPVFLRDLLYGLDITTFQSARMSPVQKVRIASLIRGQLLLDERFSDAKVTIEDLGELKRFKINVVGGSGPFGLTLNVGAAKVELVNGFV